MKNTIRIGLLAFIILTHVVEAQNLTARPFPNVTNDWLTKRLTTGSGSTFLVAGAVKKELMIFEDTYGFEVPSFFVSSPASNGSMVSLPDTNKYLLRAFDARRQIIATDAAMGSDNIPIVVWSTMPEEWQDYTPFVTYTWKCTTKSTFIKNGALDDIRVINNAINPSVVHSDDFHGPRIVYENVTPLDTLPIYGGDSLHFRFTRYSSSVYLEVPYTKSLALMELLSIGKGFFPDVKRGADGALYVLWFEADSNTAPTAAVKYRRADYIGGIGPVYTVIPERAMPRRWTLEQQPLEWQVDGSGTLIIADGPRRVIRHNSSAGITVDSLSSTGKFIVDVDILANGTVRVLWGEDWASLSSYHLYYSSSEGQPLFAASRFLGDVHYNDRCRLLTDRDGKTHLFRHGTEPMLLKNLSDGDSIIQRFTGYTILIDPMIDSSNALWAVARKDSTPVLIRYNLDEPIVPDFTFPLGIGDEWQFIEMQGTISNWELYSIKVLKDSVAHNNKTYRYLSNGLLLRKEGVKVYSYVPQDSVEYLQFDFSKKVGDTITTISGVPTWRNVVLESIDTIPFGTTFRFAGNVNITSVKSMWRMSITDSIGFTGLECLICEAVYSFQGALVNGKQYGTIVSAGGNPDIVPETIALAQNYPNPFNPSTRIEFSLPKQSLVTLKIYDVIGREVMTMVNELKEAGHHSVEWNGRNQFGLASASGVYVYRLMTENGVFSKKMFLLK